MTCTGPYFLFFCRGFKLVGPMVIMVYRMLAQVRVSLYPPPPSSEEMLLPVVDTVNPKLTLVRSASEAVGTH